MFGLIQLTSGSDVNANLLQCSKLLEQAAEQGAKIIQLPECFAYMQRDVAGLLSVAEQHGCGPIQDFLKQTSKRLDVWIIAGSLPIKANDQQVYNTLQVYDDAGALVADYRKMHLFDVTISASERYQESAYTRAGDTLRVLQTPYGRIGLSICYDLRFPALYETLREHGAEIIVAPSAFAVTTGQAHWQVLCQARAIETQCFLLAAAQVGQHDNGRNTYGHSLALSPWGEILHCRPTGVGILVVGIDLQSLSAVRQRLPSFEHRRETYRASTVSINSSRDVK